MIRARPAGLGAGGGAALDQAFAGRFVLMERLGQGGRGEVFRARDLATGKECALKRLRSPTGALDELRNEFAGLTRLRHPSVVAVYELGTSPDGTPFYTMEFVPGAPADKAIRRGDWPALLTAGHEVAHGLEALHSAGLLHGDLKPSNVLVLEGEAGDRRPRGVRLVDFGFCASIEAVSRGHRGTPGFAAPELVRGEPPSVASDLYGLGACLYALTCGRPPFEAESTERLLGLQQEGPPSGLPLAEAGAPLAWVELVLRLMAPEPRERPSDAREVRREIEGIDPAVRRPLSERLGTEVVVGRERELAALERLVAPGPSERGARRRSRLVVISGEAGVGKSAVLRELSARASLSGRPAVHVSCDGFEGPGGVARALLRRLELEVQARHPAPPAGTDVGEPAAGTPATASAPSEHDLEAMLQAMADCVSVLGDRAPVFLLDDGDRLDPLARALIRRWVLEPGLPAAAWVIASRPGPGELDDEARLLSDAGVADTVELGFLGEDDVARLASARLGDPAPDRLVSFLWERASGHPGLTVQVLHLAAERGTLAEVGAGLVVDMRALEGLAAAVGFEPMLLERFLELPESARRAAEALAAWRRPVDPEKALRIESAACPETLALLVRVGLARTPAPGQIALPSQTFADRVLGAAGDERRRALHRAILAEPGLGAEERFRHLRGAGDARAALSAAAEALGSGGNAALAEAAATLAETEVPEQAAHWHERAGRELFAQGRYSDAIPHLERALELESEAGPWLERRYLLSTAGLRAGLLERAGVEGIVLADAAPGLRSRLLTNESARLKSLGKVEAGAIAAREALALAEEAQDPEALGMSATSLAYSLLASDLDAAESMAARAVDAFKRAGQLQGEVRAIGVQAVAAHACRRPAEAERLYREALGRARAAGLRLAAGELLINLGVLLWESGDWKGMREANAEVARMALEDGRARDAAAAITNLAHADAMTGRPRNAARQARAAIRLTRAHLPALETSAWRALAGACRCAGRLRGAERTARRALELATASRLSNELEWCRVELARTLMAQRRWEEAEEVCDRAGQASPGQRSVGAVIRSLAGRAALRRGDAKLGARRLEDAERLLEGSDVRPYAEALVQQLRAEVAFVAGRFTEGIGAGEKCLARLLALPAPPDRAAAATELGQVAIESGADRQPAVGKWLEEAVAAYERLGDRRGRERALTLLVTWLRRSSARTSVLPHDHDLIRSVGELLHSLSDLRELGQRAMEMVVEQLDAERGVLLLADDESGRLVPLVEHGAVDAAMRRDAVGYSRRVVQRVAESRGSLLIQDARRDARVAFESVDNLHLRSILCVPMYLSGRVIGAVYLDDSRRSLAFGDAERGLIEGFAHLMAVAIEKARGHEEAQRTNENLVRENLSLRQEAVVKFQSHRLIGTSSAMMRIMPLVERAAHTSSTVLLTGENGTGKELIARILHHGGKRRLRPFVAVNCGAIPETLLETELFGILPNVATDVRGREGRFKQADGGTLFLDEVGDMPLKQQVALLSAIANREITPVGGGKSLPVDVRIIAATNRDLRRQIEDGAFREDLFYRLNVIPIEVPPLRERKADIPALVQHFVAQFARGLEREMPELSPEFLAAVMQSDWPGNVRELQNYIERVIAMNPGRVLYPSPLPRDLEERAGTMRLARGKRLSDLVEDLEKRLLKEALRRAGGNQSLAARELGLPEPTIRYRMRKHGFGGSRRNLRTRRKLR